MTRHQNPIADDPDPADRRLGTRWQCRRLGQGQAEQIESIQHSDVAHHLSRTSWPAPLGPSTSGRGRSAETSHYLVIPGLLDAEDLSAAQAALSEKVDMNAAELFQASLISDPLADAPCRTRLARLFDDLEPEQFLAYGRSWRDRIGGYHTLMSNPKILDAVESLIGAEIFGNPVFNVRPKVPRVAAGAVPWHQDKSYWPDANSNPVLSVWISLVDATLENGCLHVLPRTQRHRVMDFTPRPTPGPGFWRSGEAAAIADGTKGNVAAGGRGLGNPVQRQARLQLDAEQLRPRPLQHRAALPAHRPRSDAGLRCRVPGT